MSRAAWQQNSVTFYGTFLCEYAAKRFLERPLG